MGPSRQRRFLVQVAALLLCSSWGFLGWSGEASGAEIEVKGTRLAGEVLGLTAEGIRFETVYGKGVILIPYADVQTLSSEREFVLLYGEAEEARGRLWGVEEGRLLVGADPRTARRVPVGLIVRALTVEAHAGSDIEGFRARYRFWSGNFDLAFAHTDATTDTTNLMVGGRIQRQQAPTRLLLEGRYRLGAERRQGASRQTLDHRLFGHARFDYDLTERLFAFGDATGEYDEPQRLSLRAVPTAGMGYRILRTGPLTLTARTGGGYVYERYFNDRINDYATAIFGADLEAKLPLGSTFEAHLDYLPAVDDWTNNYLIRASATWSLPVLSWMDFKLTLLNDYTGRPAPETERNSFTTTAGVSLRF